MPTMLATKHSYVPSFSVPRHEKERYDQPQKEWIKSINGTVVNNLLTSLLDKLGPDLSYFTAHLLEQTGESVLDILNTVAMPGTLWFAQQGGRLDAALPSLIPFIRKHALSHFRRHLLAIQQVNSRPESRLSVAKSTRRLVRRGVAEILTVIDQEQMEALGLGNATPTTPSHTSVPGTPSDPVPTSQMAWAPTSVPQLIPSTCPDIDLALDGDHEAEQTRDSRWRRRSCCGSLEPILEVNEVADVDMAGCECRP